MRATTSDLHEPRNSRALVAAPTLRKAAMENDHIEELRAELNQLLRKQVQVLESRSLGTATDSDVLEYEIRQEIIHEMCNQLAHSSSA